MFAAKSVAKTTSMSNVPSKLRGCAAAHLTRKRRAAVSNCRSVIFNAMRDIHLMGIKPLDSGLWSGEWRLHVDWATLGECQMRLIFLLTWATSVKKFRCSDMKMCRSNTILFRAHWNKLERTLPMSRRTILHCSVDNAAMLITVNGIKCL